MSFKARLSSFLVVLFLCVAVSTVGTRSCVRAQGWIVVPDNFSTIQEAINNAFAGDNILVKAGTYLEQIIVNKSVNLIGQDRESTFLSSGGFYYPNATVTVDSDRVSVKRFTFEGDAVDLRVTARANVTVAENTFAYNPTGIDADGSANLTIVNNVFSSPAGLDNIAILLYNTVNCSIVNNTISGAVYQGIKLFYVQRALIQFNVIKGNDVGILFLSSTDNVIINNQISGNGGGLFFEGGSHGNTIYGNNFVDNRWAQVTSDDNAGNTWDNGTAGNYWSDYEMKYTDAMQTGGVWSEPYVISSNNIDPYPLVNPVIIPELESLFLCLALITGTTAVALLKMMHQKRR